MCTYETLRVYYKQGDDFHDFLENNTPSEALSKWSAQLQTAAHYLQVLSIEIENTDITFSADTHCICALGDQAILNKLVAKELLNRVPYCDCDVINPEDCTKCDLEEVEFDEED